MSESIFVDGDLLTLDDGEDDPLLPSTTPAPELVAASTPAEGPTASASTSTALEPAPAVFEGNVSS